MADVYVFARSNKFPDISTYGECGALTPTECKFEETANGDSVLTLTHPIDKEFERYRFLQNGALIAAKVPVRTTPEIQNGVLVTTVYRYKVNPAEIMSSKTQRALFSNKTGDSKIGYLEPGTYFTVVYMPDPDEHQSSGSSSESQRWKVKSDIGTGWVNPSTIAFDFDKEETIENNSSSIEAVQSPWKNVYQLFRIYEVQKSMDSVQVSARHISYDLLYNITRYDTEEAVNCQAALDGILENCITRHDFAAYTNVGNENAGLFYEGKNPIEAFLDPEEGICAKFGVQLVRDNYELYFLNDPGLNRGVSIEYAKNMTGVTVTLNEDEIATRIVPVGENEDGSKLYLSGGSASEDYAKMQNVVLKYTSDSNYSYQEEVAILKARLIELGYTDGISTNNWNYMSKTKENVIRWQNDNNRSPADGIYNGERDFTAMFSTDPYPQMNNITLQNGSRGDNVKTLQQRLTDLGYNVGSTGVDGIFGNNTEAAVRAWESDNGASSTTGIYTATRVITGSKTMYSMLFTDIFGPYIDSPYINDYPTVHTFYLECENCKVGEEEDDGTGSKKKLTTDIVKARMKLQAQKLLDEGCDKPKVSMSVEYQNLGDTEEYKQFQGLENVYLYDYVTVRYPELDIDILARVNKITWDVLLERQEGIEIGELAEQLGSTGVCTWQLPSGINGGKILNGTLNGNAMSNGTFQYVKISEAAINQLNANSITAVEGYFNTLTTEELYANALYADVAKIVKATVEHLDASLATIDFANIRELSADEAYIQNLDAGLVTATKAVIGTLMADSAYISALSAQFAHITNAMIDNANINFGTIKYLSSDQATIESLFTRDANQEDVFIKHLKVLQAQMLDATVGNLTLKADDGNYYKIDISFDQNGVPTLTPTHVTPTSSEINAGMMDSDGSRIVETTLPYEELAVGTFKAFSALITKLNADTINATHFFSNEATIGALSSPLISAAVVRAIEGSLDFWASDRINFRIDDIDYSPSQLINNTMEMNANKGWSYGGSCDRYQQLGDEKFWRARINSTGQTSDRWAGIASAAFDLPSKWQGRTIVVSADIHSDSWTGIDAGIQWSLNLSSTESGTPVRMLFSGKNAIVIPGQSKWGTDAANKTAGSNITGNWNRVYVVYKLDKERFSALSGHSLDEFDSMTRAYMSFYVRQNGNFVFKRVKVEWGNEASDWTASPADQGDLYTQLSISNDRIYAAVYDSGISSAQMLRKTQQLNLVAGDTTGRYWKNASGSTDVTQPNFITRYSVSNSEQVRMRIRSSATGWLTAKSPAFPIRDLDVGDILTLSFYGCIYYPSSGATTWNSRMQAVIVPVDESSMGGFINNSLLPSLGTTHDLIDADRTFGDADMNHDTTDPMPANNVFTRFRTKFTVTSTLKQYSYAAVFIRINGPGDFAFHSPKLERSEVATQWTAHPAELNAGSSVEIDKDGVKIKTSEFSVSLPNGQDTFVFDNKGLSAGQISSQSITGNVVNTYTGAQYVTITTKGDLKNYISNNINGHYLPQKVYLEMRQGFSDTTNLDIFGVSGEALTIQRYRSDTGTKPNISGKITVRSCSAPIIFNNMSLQNSKSTSTGEGVINTYCSFVSITGCDIMPGSSSAQNGTAIHAYQGSNVNVHNTFFVQARYAALSEEMSNVFFTTCRGLGQVGSLNRTGAIHVSNNNTHMPVPISGQNTWSITNGANVYGASGVVLDDGSGGVVPTPIPSQTSYTASVSANGYRIAQSSSGYDWTSTNVVRQGLFWENGESVKYYGAYEFTVPSSFTGTLASASITLMRRSGGASGNVTVKGYKMNNWTGSGAPSVGALLFSGTAAEGRTTEFTITVANLGMVSATTPNNKIRIVIVADDSTMPAGASESTNAAVFGGMADGTTFMTLNV